MRPAPVRRSIYNKIYMDLAVPVTEEDHLRGDMRAPVTLVEYGDFECQHCRAAYPVVQDILERFDEPVRFVFRHFPLRPLHAHAEHAAESAEIADALAGRFWDMHDLLFEHQEQLEDEWLVRYAAALELPVEKFTALLAAHAFQPRVDRDLMSGLASEVVGTPAFFINGARHTGPATFHALTDAIRRAMQ